LSITYLQPPIVFANTRNTTDDISLLNPYFYRLIHRADAMDPGKEFTPAFKPISIKETISLFRESDKLKSIQTSAKRYYSFEAEEKDIENLSIHALEESHFKLIHSQKKDAPLYGELGAEIDGHNYFSLIGEGNAYLRDVALLSCDLRLSNDGDVDNVDFFRYKLKAGFEHISISAAKENIIVGPGYFGNLLMSGNVQPENSIIVKTEKAYNWGFLGAFRWYAWHTWFDDEERYSKNPRLWGVRTSLRPWDILEVAFTRTALYGGSKGNPYDNLDAYWEMLTGVNENVADNPYNSQQQASFDVSVYLPFIESYSPFTGGKIYMEYAFTDIRGFWQAGNNIDDELFMPLHDSYLFGLQLTTGQTDIFLEYVETSYASYSGSGGGFRLGYTDNGYIIGHFAGEFVHGAMGEVYHELFPYFHVYTGLGYFDHRNKIGKAHQIEKNIFAGGVYFLSENILMNLKCAYIQFTKTDIDPSPVSSTFTDDGDTNTFIYLTLDYHF
jgi:hypothetical protein